MDQDWEEKVKGKKVGLERRIGGHYDESAEVKGPSYSNGLHEIHN